ncbi:MAG: sigma-70 family RNA polymerase sigma factor [Ignavibacteria bacterium]|jgi:predicted DNA-binding protein (UPF0251 family)
MIQQAIQMIEYEIDDPRYKAELSLIHEAIDKVLETLTDREAQAVRLYYFNKMTYQAAGKLLNVSRERFRQILAKAERKMRHPDRSKYLRSCLYGMPVSHYEDEEFLRIKKERDDQKRIWEESQREKAEMRQEMIRIQNLIMEKGDDLDIDPPSFVRLISNGFENGRLTTILYENMYLTPYLYQDWLTKLAKKHDRRSSEN